MDEVDDTSTDHESGVLVSGLAVVDHARVWFRAGIGGAGVGPRLVGELGDHPAEAGVVQRQ